MSKPCLKQNIDSAGGLIIGGSSNVFIEGCGAVRKNDMVLPHGKHTGVTINQGSETVFVNERPIARAGDLATCGHEAKSSGTNVYSG